MKNRIGPRWTIIYLAMTMQIAFAYDYEVHAPISLKQLAEQQHKRVSYLSIEQYQEQLLKWNTHIKRDELITEGTQLYLHAPYPYFVSDSNYAKTLYKGFERRKFYLNMDFGIGLFRREQSQEIGELGLKLKSVQNAPVSIDTTFFLVPKSSRAHYEFNLGYSYLMPSKTNGNQELPQTNEYKASTYLLYRLEKFPSLSLKGGFSYQHIIAYDLRKLSTSDQVEQHNYDIGYWSIGLRFDHQLWGTFYNELALNYASAFISKNTYDEQSSDARIWNIQSTIKMNMDIRFVLFYELEKSTLSGLRSQLQRYGFGVRFITF